MFARESRLEILGRSPNRRGTLELQERRDALDLLRVPIQWPVDRALVSRFVINVAGRGVGKNHRVAEGLVDLAWEMPEDLPNSTTAVEVSGLRRHWVSGPLILGAPGKTQRRLFVGRTEFEGVPQERVFVLGLPAHTDRGAKNVLYMTDGASLDGFRMDNDGVPPEKWQWVHNPRIGLVVAEILNNIAVEK